MENIVYTIHPCPYCMMVKNLLTNLDIPFEERLITSREEMLKLKDTYLWQTFPMVILNGEFVGGYDDTKRLVDRGKLDEILKS